MGLDSVEMVMGWEETFGITLEDSELISLHTPGEAIDLISVKLGAVDGPGFCAPMRAFHLFRTGVRTALSDPNRKVRPSDSLRSFQKGLRRTEFWDRFHQVAGFNGFRHPAFHRATVQAAVEGMIAFHLRLLRRPSEPWTRSLVRCGVRYGVIDTVGVRKFSDDDRFIEDIGLD